MVISRKQLDELVAINVDIEKTSAISSDGKNLLFRIPKEIVEFLKLKKKDKIKWHVSTNKNIKLEVMT